MKGDEAVREIKRGGPVYARLRGVRVKLVKTDLLWQIKRLGERFWEARSLVICNDGTRVLEATRD